MSGDSTRESDDSMPESADGSSDSSDSNHSDDERSLGPSEQRRAVRQRYGSIATGSEESGCCDDGAAPEPAPTSAGEPGAAGSSCRDGGTDDAAGVAHAQALGYSREDLERVADGANLGLGCGNPNAIAGLADGETVLDLGSGGGFDCFLAADEVGPDGRVIGVDMTPEMVERARGNVASNDLDNVEFRLGEIEHLPVPDESVDVVISNCVINLSPEKRRVFEEAYRVLRPGGRLAVTDVVMTADVSPAIDRADPEQIAACVAGAATIDELETLLADAGFESVSIRPKEDSEGFISEWSDEYPLEEYIVSAVIEAERPDAFGAGAGSDVVD
jgi:SAM-dependent methyltransferase